SDPAVNSAATEILYDGIDNDCNPATPDTIDADGDGENSDTDCDDSNPAVNSAATEILYDGIDNDCNPATPDTIDADGDGENSDTDCDDSDPAVNSSATEILYDGIDNDCNPATPDTVDADGDGENSDTDCDDSDPAINSAATEILYDGIDNDCNPATPDTIDADGDGENSDTDCDDSNPAINSSTVWYADTDGDGYGDITNSVASCTQPAGYVADDSDCDDTTISVHPNAPEICDGIDNNCDGNIDEGVTTTFYADLDNDGYGDSSNSIDACSQPVGYVSNDSDCDDSDFTINPDATDIPNDGIDQDCNGEDQTTLDLGKLGMYKISVTPNPFNDFIQIELPEGYNNGEFNIRISDLNGRLVIDAIYLSKNGLINVSGLNQLDQAPYLLKIENIKNGAAAFRRLIKN
ncbi:MopE-related protein, partial [Flavobacteriaceae bacterium SZ-1-7]|uniref:MopE-related protein n=1 Tax=Tamlana sedimenti TaxID=3134126 RepID=UPI0031284764